MDRMWRGSPWGGVEWYTKLVRAAFFPCPCPEEPWEWCQPPESQLPAAKVSECRGDNKERPQAQEAEQEGAMLS